jgi:hypothetical protein
VKSSGTAEGMQKRPQPRTPSCDEHNAVEHGSEACERGSKSYLQAAGTPEMEPAATTRTDDAFVITRDVMAGSLTATDSNPRTCLG